MNITDFSDQLQNRLKEKLSESNVEQDELLKVGALLTFIRETVRELKEFTFKYKFINEAEEIKFFKQIMPVFLSQFYYYKKIFEIRLFDSFRDVKTRHSNYCHILQKLERYVSKNSEFYKYYLTNMTYLDNQYFTRGKNMKSIELNEKVLTGYDIKLGKLLANDLIKSFAMTWLNKSQSESFSGRGSLTWTGSKTALIELVYALHAIGAFNNGSADIKLIAVVIENSFNISLGNYYRVFQDIRIRKGSSTSFLESLREKLRHLIDNMND